MPTAKLISCRPDESDLEALRSHAASLELNQSDYIRHLIRIPIGDDGLATGTRIVALDTKTFGRIYSELVRWGRHYNQAVRAMNTIALHLRRGKIDEGMFSEQIACANAKLEAAETGRAEVLKELERLETLTLIGGQHDALPEADSRAYRLPEHTEVS